MKVIVLGAGVVGTASAWYLAADGPERIVLNYDFNDPAYIGPDPTSIVKVEFDYVLANDFRVEMWSDRQTGQRSMPASPRRGSCCRY